MNNKEEKSLVATAMATEHDRSLEQLAADCQRLTAEVDTLIEACQPIYDSWQEMGGQLSAFNEVHRPLFTTLQLKFEQLQDRQRQLDAHLEEIRARAKTVAKIIGYWLADEISRAKAAGHSRLETEIDLDDRLAATLANTLNRQGLLAALDRSPDDRLNLLIIF